MNGTNVPYLSFSLSSGGQFAVQQKTDGEGGDATTTAAAAAEEPGLNRPSKQSAMQQPSSAKVCFWLWMNELSYYLQAGILTGYFFWSN